jgi:predicted transcriptional regulator
MSRYLVIPKFQEEVSDTLSTSTPLSHAASPSRLYHRNEDTISSKSKKVRKKRSAYQKIDDDIRVKLLEAVQQNGETLKSAAKRYGINYSSAKSILHTYRKEGRILKKSAQERTIKKHPDSASSEDYYPEVSHNPIQNQTPSTYSFRHFRPNLTINTDTKIDHESDIVHSPEKIVSPSSPMNRLSDKFVNLLHLNHPNLFEKSNLRSRKIYKNLGQNAYRDCHQLEKSDIDFNHPNFQAENNIGIQPEKIPDNPSQINKYDMVKAIDNFYMNYSNSPLSSEKILKNGISSPQNIHKNKEFDSFSDMISALQNKNSEELKEDKYSSFRPQHKDLEQNIVNENEVKGSIENAAIDTFRTVVDAQLMLCDALKKASFLNNLVQSHKIKEQTEKSQD